MSLCCAGVQIVRGARGRFFAFSLSFLSFSFPHSLSPSLCSLGSQHKSPHSTSQHNNLPSQSISISIHLTHLISAHLSSSHSARRVQSLQSTSVYLRPPFFSFLVSFFLSSFVLPFLPFSFSSLTRSFSPLSPARSLALICYCCCYLILPDHIVTSLHSKWPIAYCLSFVIQFSIRA